MHNSGKHVSIGGSPAKSNKDFDLLLLPNLGHESSSYIIRRVWDYFVKHLQGAEPPAEFTSVTWVDL